MSNQMIQYQLFGIKDLREVKSKIPEINEREVLVKVKSCGICPTDYRKYSVPNYNKLDFPFNPGHEWSGEIVELGAKVKKFKKGDRIVAEGEGGYAEYAKINEYDLEYATKLPDSVTFDAGTFTEPLADCIHAVKRANVVLGSKVVVLGAGTMGLQITSAASLSGAEVIVSEPNLERRELAKDFGADITVNPTKENLYEIIADKTNGEMVDACIVTIGNKELIKEAIYYVGRLGTILLFGGGEKGLTAEIDPNWIHYNEITFTGSHWVGVEDRPNPNIYKTALNFIKTKKVPVEKLITHKMPLNKVHEGYELIEKKESLKIILDIEGKAKEEQSI